jgi:hypothetical protein
MKKRDYGSFNGISARSRNVSLDGHTLKMLKFQNLK